MKAKHLILLLKFVAITVPLTWWWMSWGQDAYARVFEDLARPIYRWLGLRTLRPTGGHERFINFLPFLVLMLLTPRLSVLRRVVGTAIGCVVLFLFHVGFSIATSWGPRVGGTGMTEAAFEISFPAYLFSDSLPFLIWVIVAHRVVADFATQAMERLVPEAPTREP